MKKLVIIPILSICFLGASTKNMEVVKVSEIQKINPIDKLEYHPENKIERLDSLMKEL